MSVSLVERYERELFPFSLSRERERETRGYTVLPAKRTIMQIYGGLKFMAPDDDDKIFREKKKSRQTKSNKTVDRSLSSI